MSTYVTLIKFKVGIFYVVYLEYIPLGKEVLLRKQKNERTFSAAAQVRCVFMAFVGS